MGGRTVIYSVLIALFDSFPPFVNFYEVESWANFSSRNIYTYRVIQTSHLSSPIHNINTKLQDHHDE